MKMERATFGALVIAVATLGACSSGDDIQPGTWSCDKLVRPIIEMSQDEDVQILEITAVEERAKSADALECKGNAEWSRGYGVVDFGARVSDGGSIMLEYQQR